MKTATNSKTKTTLQILVALLIDVLICGVIIYHLDKGYNDEAMTVILVFLASIGLIFSYLLQIVINTK